ncbi:MAG: alpha-L-arabinofuranosidase C-terminal domain-containing protein [Chitinophagales bacterium]
MQKHYLLSILTLLLISQLGVAQTNTSTVIYHLDSAEHQISKHIYGHFAEHLGRCIYDGFWVEEDSKIPNQGRIRTDIIEALKELSIPSLRWPGGCFADTYHWKDGIGPREDRPTMVNVHWGNVTEDNSFGTHEFFELCELLDCEPIICGNLGSGTVQEMAQWVEYINSNNISPMTKLREQNGRKEPFKIKYWGVGNENWGCGGNMTAQYYTDNLRRYSSYLKDYGDQKLYKIAGGGYGDYYDWTETLMKDEKGRKSFDGLSLHYYTLNKTWAKKGDAVEFGEADWFSTMTKTLLMEEHIQKHTAIMDKYDPEKTKGLIVDEWGNWHDSAPGSNPAFLYQQNTLRDALVASVNLDMFNNHCERVKMANIAQAVNVLQSVILTKGNEMVLTPTYYVFKMYKVHHDATLIPHQKKSASYTFNDKKIEAVHTSCSKDANGKIHVTITNLDPNNGQVINCSFEGATSMKALKGKYITASKMNDLNDFGKKETIIIQDFMDYSFKKGELQIKMPSKSIVMIELEEK